MVMMRVEYFLLKLNLGIGSSREITASRNRILGQRGEDIAYFHFEALGFEVERNGHAWGSDFIARRKNSNDEIQEFYIEVKSGEGELSELQKRMKKKYRDRYIVYRPNLELLLIRAFPLGAVWENIDIRKIQRKLKI